MLLCQQIGQAAVVVVDVVVSDEDAYATARQIRYAAEGDTQLAGDEAWAADTDNSNFTDCGLNISNISILI